MLSATEHEVTVQYAKHTVFFHVGNAGVSKITWLSQTCKEMQGTYFVWVLKLPQIPACKCIRKDSPPDSPGARSPTTVREASEKMTSVQEDTVSHCHDCHDAVVTASKFSEVSTPVAMKFWFVLQGQSESGEQHR